MNGYRAAFEADSGERPDILEGLLDSTDAVGPQQWTPLGSVRAVVEELAEVCHTKDAHVSEGFGERDVDAREWRKAAALLEQLGVKLRKAER